ncbi:MAG: hypothetical protein EXS00_04565, partial [Phycisphaerales bacterium]|nr:hypothetical protein [Phycisphaerales bacterium]
QKALELIFQAFRINGLGVVETDDLIMIDLITSLTTLQPALVLGPDVDLSRMADLGQVVIKVYKIKNTKATGIFDRLSANLPEYARIEVDGNSNQIILEGDAGLAKRCQALIDLLDVPPYVDVLTETFRLEFTDAQQVADNISTLFGSTRSGSSGGNRTNQQSRGGRAQQAGQPAEAQAVGTSEQLVVTTQPSANSVTVRAEPEILGEIRNLIHTEWDIPINVDGDPFRIYDLKYADPLKVKELLGTLLGSSGGATSGGNRGGSNRVVLQGGGGDSGADAAVANIFMIEAYPDSNRLIVVTKTPDNFRWLDDVIARIDQPLNAGLPISIPLKYQNCVELAEIVNALLAEAGSGATITAPDQGLSGIDFQAAGGGTGDTSGGGSTEDRAQGATIEFPWQSGRGAGGEATQREPSALVGKARVVPNASQNSVLVLAPPEIQESLISLINQMDKPDRQVMIEAILAEVELGEQLQYGVRFGPDGSVKPANQNNAVVIGTNVDGVRDTDFPEEFNAFLFDFAVDATVVLQALDQDTAVRILQQPRIVTSDNKEAIFFQGQDIPFQASQSQGSTTGGSTVSSFEQIAVGIGVNVRPRITVDGNVAMEIEVLLSNTNSTTPLGVGNNPVIDRRQTNTTITVKDGQTILISGIRIENEASDKTGFPILGDIPILDLIFSSKEKTTFAKELLIFITPIVIENPDANDNNFNVEELERLRSLTRPLAESSDAMLQRQQKRGLVPTPRPGTKAPIAPITAPGDKAQQSHESPPAVEPAAP